MKETTATTHIEVLCKCPNCDFLMDVFDEVKESMDEDHRASEIDVEVTCENCNERFLVTDIDF